MTLGVNGHPRERLSEYLDDQLGVEERTATDRHLASCEDCRAELETLRLLTKAVGEEQVPPVPAELSRRIGRSVDLATVVQFKKSRFVVPATIAATIGAIGLLVALQWREGNFVAPAAPAPAQRVRATSELKRAAAPSESDTKTDTLTERQLPTVKETPTTQAKDADIKVADESVVSDLRKQKKNERLEFEAGVAAGVEARVADSAAQPPVFKAAVVPSCLERWSDSSLRGSWDVPDLDAAERQLGRLAHAVGGNGLWRGVADGRPYVVVVPRAHFEEVFYALRARGVAGLGEPPTLAEGVDCVGISIMLTLVAEPASPSPR